MDAGSTQRGDFEREEAGGRFARLVANLNGMVYRCRNDPLWTMEYVSSGSLGLTGYAPAQLQGNREVSFGQLIHPDDRETVWETIQQALGQNQAFTLTYRLRDRAGVLKWVWEQGCGVRAPDGGLAAIEGFITDISGLRRAEAELKQVRDIVTSSPAVVFLWRNAPGWPAEVVTENVEQIFGWSAGEIVAGAVSYADLVHPEDRERVEREVAAACADPQTRTFRQEYRVLARDGRTRWVEDRTLIRRDEQGRISHFQGIVIDRTETRKMEDSLRRERGRLKLILDNLPDGVCLIDREHRLEYANPCLEREFGPPDGRRCHEFFHGRSTPCPWCRSEEVHRGSAARWEWDTAENGRAYEVLALPLPQEFGTPGRLELFHDITDRRKVAEQARQNESRLQVLLNIAQYAAADVQDLLDYTLEQAIRLTGSQFGFIGHYDEKRHELSSCSWSSEVRRLCALAPSDATHRLEGAGLWSEAIRRRQPLVVNDYTAPRPSRGGLPAGHIPLSRFMTVPVFDEQRIVAVIGVADKEADYVQTDLLQLSLVMDSAWKVVRRRQAEERTGHLNGVLRTIRDINQLTARQHDPDLLIQETCRLLIRNRGYRAALAILTGPDGLPRAWAGAGLETGLQPLEAGLREGRLPPCCALPEVSAEGLCAACALEDGQALHEPLCVRLSHAGRPLGFLIVHVDRGTGIDAEEKALLDDMAADVAFALHGFELTTAVHKKEQERARFEAQLLQAQKMEAIGHLAGGIAHDFNNLLSVINGYSDLALAGMRPDEPLRHELQQIHETGLRAAELTRQLLAFSRKQVLRPEVLDLNRVVRGMARMLRRLIGERIELAISLADGLSRVMADKGQLEQVILNLAINARDAMPAGGRLSIETADVEAGGAEAAQPRVQLAVRDTGVGMSGEVLSHLFEPFFTTKEAGKGTGLGLATVYGIVRQSGGDIWAESEPGRGTVFRIQLPPAGEGEQAPAAPRPGTARGGTETVLVVEDEEAIRLLAGRMLASAGYRVLSAAGGEEALALAERQDPRRIDLLLTDVVMPGLGGRETAERLLARFPGMKVLYMSGYTDGTLGPGGLPEHGARLLPKPFGLAELTAAVRQTLDGEGGREPA